MTALALLFACGDMPDDDAPQRFAEAVARHDAASGGDRSRPYRRPSAQLEVDVMAPLGDAGASVPPIKTRQVKAPDKRIWQIKPAADARAALLGPTFTFSERKAHTARVSELAAKKKLVTGDAGEVRLRIRAQAVTRDMVLQAARLSHRYHDAWVSAFGAPAARLPDAFVATLEKQPPADMAGIAALYREHVDVDARGPQPGLDLSLLDATPKTMDLRYRSATVDAEALLLYVDTVYALLHMAHVAGPFEAQDYQPVAGVSVQDAWLSAVRRIEPALAKRLESAGDAAPAAPAAPEEAADTQDALDDTDTDADAEDEDDLESWDDT